MTSAPAPGLQLLGSVCWHAAGGGGRVAFQAERRFQLLALLACHDTPVPRSRLAGWLWPEREPADARRNLRKVLLQAHRLCAELPQAPPLELHGEQLRWHPATDLHGFLRACDGPDPARAVQAYRPGLLAGLEAGLGDDALEWLARQRAWLDERWHAAARRWLDGLRHAPQAQAAAAEQVLARDPLDEAALRTLLQACAALGERTRGLRALQAYGVRLCAELGAAPSPELAALGQALHPAPAPMVTPRVRETSDSAVQAIVLAAMDTVADASHWPVLLQRLTQATHGLGSLFAGCSFTRSQDGLLLTHGLDTALGQRFLDRYQDNPWARGMARVRPGRGVDQMQFTDQRTLERTAFYQEIIRPQGILNMAAMGIPMDAPFTTGGVSIGFGGPHASEHVAQAVRLLEHLAPYLQRAMAALLRRRRLPCAEALAAGLDRLPGAVLILAAGGQVLFANARAEALLVAGDGLCLRAGRLAAARPADAPRLDALLAQAAQAPRPLATLRAHLRLHRPAGRPALGVSVLPMRDGRDRLQLPGRAAVLVLAEELP
ncbi:BTAD domain-containing putative transcriptional regulator [Alicycliphilus denitrificans]|uniref:AfsR/SARP family transcriptional regulator n=1 Tax=Alicycliphilus denitrificans TaxID=179636 RepID=UPI00095DFD86|nr:BTAD domain-containing putative transcriptional regulator [Alicycliphilus denitrificans]MBN9574442.1 hypothetical protein [Alicycliphilus denitrificans]OJW88590.1 MAG: hypothetical protein BGO66_03580 [Alicycliphilus sp. 69-12]